MAMDKRLKALILDTAKHALKKIEPAQACLGECETELAEAIEETIRDFCSALLETEEDHHG